MLYKMSQCPSERRKVVESGNKVRLRQPESSFPRGSERKEVRALPQRVAAIAFSRLPVCVHTIELRAAAASTRSLLGGQVAWPIVSLAETFSRNDSSRKSLGRRFFNTRADSTDVESALDLLSDAFSTANRSHFAGRPSSAQTHSDGSQRQQGPALGQGSRVIFRAPSECVSALGRGIHPLSKGPD